MADAHTDHPQDAIDDRDRVSDGPPPRGVTNLSAAAGTLLDQARASTAGRAGQTLTPGAGVRLKQTLLALAGGRSLAEHASPAAGTLHVLVGTVRLTSGAGAVELQEGDHTMLPSARHGLDALDDAVMLLTVTQESTPG